MTQEELLIESIRQKIIELRSIDVLDLPDVANILTDFLTDPPLEVMVRDSFKFKDGRIFEAWHNANRIILKKAKDKE